MPGELDGIRVVALPGVLDADTAAAVFAVLARGMRDGTAVVVADLAATSYCTLEGLAALVHAAAAARTAGAQLRLAAVGPPVRRMLDRTGVTRMLALYPSVAAAGDSSRLTGDSANITGSH